MTPAEHYLRAEHLIEVMAEEALTGSTEFLQVNATVALIHAQLATAGATFLHGQGGVYPSAHDAFVDAIFPTPGPEVSHDIRVRDFDALARTMAAQVDPLDEHTR